MLKNLNRPIDPQTRNQIRNVLLFTLLTYILEEILLASPHYRHVVILGFADPRDRVIGAATMYVSFFFTAILFWSVLHSPPALKIASSIFIISSFLLEYGFQTSVQRYSLPADIIMGLNSPVEMWVDAGSLYLTWLAVVPSAFYLLFIIKYSVTPSWKKSTTGLGIVILGIALIHAIPMLRSVTLNWGSSPTQLASTIYRYGVSQLFPTKREELLIKINEKPANNIVLIVDESVSADFLSINGFERATTPYLELLKKDTEYVHNWGIATSGATCSEVSNALILTGTLVPDRDYRLAYRHPIVYQYAKAAGYKTYYIDAQTSWLWNGITDEDAAYIDEWIVAPNLGETEYQRDFAAADMIRKIVDSGTGNFIVLNKRGTHFPYETVYPPQEKIWRPVPRNADEYHNYEVVLNSYNNAILYNVNAFFTHLFPDSAQMSKYVENTYYIYTSDHGQTLYRENAGSLHCGFNHLEARVPLILFGDFPTTPDISYLGSHSNILPTILDLMNIPHELQAYSYNISLLQAKAEDSTDRFYFRTFTNEIYNFDQLEKQEQNQSIP